LEREKKRLRRVRENSSSESDMPLAGRRRRVEDLSRRLDQDTIGSSDALRLSSNCTTGEGEMDNEGSRALKRGHDFSSGDSPAAKRGYEVQGDSSAGKSNND
jgi:hypothetical protein